MGIIYCYTNKTTGMKYVGQTINGHSRKMHHLREAKNNSTGYFHQAIREFGIDNFDYQVLEECLGSDKKLLSDREAHWIEQLNTLAPNGYNAYIRPCSLSPEIREKISQKNRGRIKTEVELQRMSEAQKGKVISLETREKIRQFQKGRVKSIETREKLSKALTGKPSHKQTLETREKIRKTLTGRKSERIVTIETRQKMSAARKGKLLSPEIRKNMSLARKGKPLSPETKLKRDIIYQNKRLLNKGLVIIPTKQSIIGDQI